MLADLVCPDPSVRTDRDAVRSNGLVPTGVLVAHVLPRSPRIVVPGRLDSALGAGRLSPPSPMAREAV